MGMKKDDMLGLRFRSDIAICGPLRSTCHLLPRRDRTIASCRRRRVALHRSTPPPTGRQAVSGAASAEAGSDAPLGLIDGAALARRKEGGNASGSVGTDTTTAAQREARFGPRIAAPVDAATVKERPASRASAECDRLLASEPFSAWSIAVGHSNVYWLGYDGMSPGTLGVMRVGIGGGTPSRLPRRLNTRPAIPTSVSASLPTSTGRTWTSHEGRGDRRSS